MSSRSPRHVSADLAAANAALDVCAALLRAQGDETPAAPRAEPEPARPDPRIEEHRARLDEFASALASLTDRYRGEDAAGAAARAVAEYSNKVMDAKRASLKTAPKPVAAKPPPQSVQRDHATQRALRAAIDRYFSYFEIPGTSWRLDWRLLDTSGMPSATAYGSSPGDIEGAYTIALPDEAPWRIATKLVTIEPVPSKAIGIVAGGAKPVAPGKLFIVGLSWSAGAGSIVLSRSKKKLASPMRVSYPGDGTVAVCALDAAGNAAGPPATQSGETAAYLDAVWWKMCAAAMGLIHGRGDAVSLTFEGADAQTLASPANMADVIMAANESLLAKVNDEVDDAMRAKLASKFDDVPARFRGKLKGIVVSASRASEAAKPVAAKPVAAKPVAAKPVAAKPVAAKPVAAKPAAAEPMAAKPTEPAAAKPAAPAAAATKPMAPPDSAPIGIAKAPALTSSSASPAASTSSPEAPRRRMPRGSSPIEPMGMAARRMATPTAQVTSSLPATTLVDLDGEPTKVSRNTIARGVSAHGSGPIPNPASKMFRSPISMPGMTRPKTAVSRPNDPGDRLFGQKTIDEKFESLDLEIDWDDDDFDDENNDQTLPGVTPSVRRPTTVTIQS